MDSLTAGSRDGVAVVAVVGIVLVEDSRGVDLALKTSRGVYLMVSGSGVLRVMATSS